MSQPEQIIHAIQLVRTKVNWKPNSAERHLVKRKQRGHLPPSATLEDYESIIFSVLNDETAQLYLYWYNQVAYVTVVGLVDKQNWLVMFALDGLLESAFVVERPERYLNKPGFEYVSLLSEVENGL